MAKSSSRPRPGDSAPDFSHLAGQDAADDEAPWMPPADEADASPSADAPQPPQPQESLPTELPTSPDVIDEAEEGGEEAVDSSEDESHVFFDTDDLLSDDPDALSGETVAMTGRDVDMLPPLEERLPVDVPDKSLLAELTPETASPQASRITDFGLPAFAGLDDADSDEIASEDDAPADIGPVDTATETEEAASVATPDTLPSFDEVSDDESPTALAPTVEDETEGSPPFPSAGDAPLGSSAGDAPLFPSADEQVADSDEPTFPSPADSTLPDDDGPMFPGPADAQANEPDEPAFPSAGDATSPADEGPMFPGPTDADHDGPAFSTPDAEPADESSLPAAAVATAAVAGQPEQQADVDEPSKPQSAEPIGRTGTSDPSAGKQRMLLILLASYASAVTLALVWLWFSRNNVRPHDLESLPDVAPLGENEFRYPAQSATMPQGHTLPLGGGQQLGFIKVEPLRVTRGPVAYTHYSDVAATKPPTEPVLKLWLRFTNVSKDQLIAPLDAPLLFKREYDKLGGTELANQMLFPTAREGTGGSIAFMLDHPEASEWDLKGQQLGERLKPGESVETYIPTAPGEAAGLTGDLLWRVHFRKGYNPQTGHGVTTMIEVPFNSSDVRTET